MAFECKEMFRVATAYHREEMTRVNLPPNELVLIYMSALEAVPPIVRLCC
jgi:hypothetical protein